MVHQNAVAGDEQHTSLARRAWESVKFSVGVTTRDVALTDASRSMDAVYTLLA